MLWMTRKVDYALLALHVLLCRGGDGQAVRVTEISRTWEVPQKFLSKIMKDLVDARIVRSKYGPGGGYVLAKRPEHISFRDVIEAVEGPIYLQACVKGDPDCGRYHECPQLDTWYELQKELLRLLESKTLDRLQLSAKPVE